ncbi:MAG: DUF3492 domain-containing protein, partial [Gracilimonas sp.]|nr:DUF3492 domain-containing protein [Gracilimonas sp.]
MNVLLIIEGTYPWYRGGVSEWIYQYLHHLSEINFTIIQIATDEFKELDPNDALYPITKNIQEFIRVDPPESEPMTASALEPWYHQLYSEFSELDSMDLIHVTNTGFAGWLGARIKSTYNRPMILTEHAIYWKEVEIGANALECGYQIPQDTIGKKHTIEFFRELAKTTYKVASEIFTVSKINISEQQKLGAKNIKYVPNGISKQRLQASKKRADAPHIAWVGRCAEMKNPLAFFDYVKQFRHHQLSPKFSMLLCDANENVLKDKVRETAKKYPEVDVIWNEQAAKYYKDFDFLIITSKNESQPLVMLESIASKAIPVGYQVG